ncbi:hypothetical protein NDZ61_004893, partial [Salmonella enterica]|nr:hypothetical protein [Salmonella enterica]
AAQPVSPAKTALVFLAGDPVPSGTTVATGPDNPRAYYRAAVDIFVTAKDAHGYVVPGWLLAPEVNITPDQDIFRVNTLKADPGGISAELTFKSVSIEVLLSEKVRKAVTTVTVGPNVTAQVDTSLVPNVGICLDPGDGALPDDSTIRGAIVGVSTWRLCVYDYDDANKYTVWGYVPQKYEATYDAALHSNDFADGKVIGQKLKFKKGLSWSNGASHGAAVLVTATETVRDLIQADVLKNPAREIANSGGVWTGQNATVRKAPEFVGFFTGYSQWSSSDRDRDNMGSKRPNDLRRGRSAR